MAQRVAVFGGTFDPVHNAHLALARAALSALGAERVLWIPTGAPPYRRAPVASAEHRVAMLRLALAGEPRHAIDERELAPGHSGYTVDTLRSLRAELGAGVELVLLMGADQYATRDTWHRWEEVARLARIAVAQRPGAPAPGEGALVVPFAPMDVSASAIRARLARGEDVSALVPPAVLAYIRAHGLYRR
ncbi:MAG: nicotinate (nicotinamide) nucleotide adenylyltransferase [Burkholderiales bacterium]|nr:nicotinate (nicotinamide) nucleotide adenylyltransferase [Burkholderiales bacterium]